jgi:exosome complex component CSL4
MSHPNGRAVAPGDRIGSIRSLAPGKGTYVKGRNVHASVVGRLSIVASSTNDAKDNEQYIANVVLSDKRQSASTQVLSVGQVILGRVLRIIPQQAFLEIVFAENCSPPRESLAGSIRREDVRAGASEEVEIYASFQPGDIVLTRIISLGDSRRYQLSTAENELGVIRATCSACGAAMNPRSWKEMECICGQKELRKSAKPRDTEHESKGGSAKNV